MSNICYACTTGNSEAFVLSQNSARKSSRLRRRRRNVRLARNTLIPLPLPSFHSPLLSSRNFESRFDAISSGIPRTCASNILRDRNFSLHPASLRLLDLRRPLYEEEWPLVSTGNQRNSRSSYRRRVVSDERLVIDDIERELLRCAEEDPGEKWGGIRQGNEMKWCMAKFEQIGTRDRCFTPVKYQDRVLGLFYWNPR